MNHRQAKLNARAFRFKREPEAEVARQEQQAARLAAFKESRYCSSCNGVLDLGRRYSRYQLCLPCVRGLR